MTIGLDPFRALRPRDWQRGSTTLLTWRTPGADSNDTAVIGHIDADITVWSNGKALVASGLPIPRSGGGWLASGR
jgi:hypothetical protein